MIFEPKLGWNLLDIITHMIEIENDIISGSEGGERTNHNFATIVRSLPVHYFSLHRDTDAVTLEIQSLLIPFTLSQS